LSFFVSPIKIVSLSALNEMFLGVLVYPKIPREMSIGSSVVLVWGVVLVMEPACALPSKAGSGALPLLLETISLLAFPQLIDMLYRLKWLKKRGRKSSASHHSEEFAFVYFNKIKRLRNEREKWYFIRERNVLNELNTILSIKIEEWAFLHIWLKISLKINADILK